MSNLKKLLGRQWIARRMYGQKIWKRRDCSHVDVIPDNAQKNAVIAAWAMETARQVDITGKERITQRPKMIFRFPRNTLPTTTHAPSAVKAAAKMKHYDAILKIQSSNAAKRQRLTDIATETNSSNSRANTSRFDDIIVC
jgi:hypothetical protein